MDIGSSDFAVVTALAAGIPHGPIGGIDFAIGIVLALVLLDKIMFWVNRLKKPKNGKDTIKEVRLPTDEKNVIYGIRDTINDMYKMHDVKDEGGTPVWYCQSMKPTLENQTHAIEKMNLNIEKAMFLVEQHYKKRG